MYMMFAFIRRRRVVFGTLCLLLLCLVFVPQLVFANIGDGITSVINYLVGGFMKGLEWLVSLFQFLFLQVIQFTILDFANHWKDNGLLSDFRVVWQVLRDFVNLSIVVLFVLTAMMTVLDAKGQFGFHRKGLLYLIAAAVFVNFSAFFTLLVIDVSHILFMLFFNALDVSTLGSFSPFSGYSEVLGSTADGFFNIILGVIASVVNWFIILGILYFCIILIERYIIAMFLVLFSPFAALGFFTNMSGGGNPLADKFSGVYKVWSERLSYVFTMPVILIVGFALLLVLFRGALGQMVDPDNFVKLIGVNTPEGRGILLQLLLASIVLILGIFKVGEFAKAANFHPALAKKLKFGFGEFMSKGAKSLAKGKPLLGAFRTLQNPAGRGVFGYKQKLYNQRKEWQQARDKGEKTPWIAKVPGVGKSLDVGGRVRRGRQRAESVVRGTKAVAGGQSGRNVDWQNAEANEDKRIWDIIRDPRSTKEQKEDLLKQALDEKSNVTLNEQQTAELARNDKLHPLISSLKKGVSQGTLRQIQSDAEVRAKELAAEKDAIAAEKDALPAEYQEKRQGLAIAKVNYQSAELAHTDLMQQKNLAQEEFNVARDAFEQTDTYKDFKREMRNKQQVLETVEQSGDAKAIEEMKKNIQNFEENFYKTTATADPDFLAQQQKLAVLEKMKDSLRTAEGAMKSADNAQQSAEKAFAGASSRHETPIRQRSTTNDEARRVVTQIFSNLATNTAAGTSVAGSAAAVFDSNALTDAREKRESVSAPIDEQFQKMRNDYAKSSAVALEDLKAEQESIKEKNAEENADLLKKQEEYAREKMRNPNSDVLTDRMQELQKEIGVLEQEAAARRKRSLAIRAESGRIDSIREGLEEQDVSDSEKLAILGESVKSTKSFVQGGTQYLTDQLKVVADKMTALEAAAKAEGSDVNSNSEYTDLQDEQSRITNRVGYIGRVGDSIAQVGESLDEQKAILESPEYKDALGQEQYLTMFSVKTLLRDIESAMGKRKKEFNEKEYKKLEKKMKEQGEEGKPKVNKNAHKEDPVWKALDQQKKNLKKIQTEGGASAELQQAAVKAAEQLAKQQAQKKKQQNK